MAIEFLDDSLLVVEVVVVGVGELDEGGAALVGAAVDGDVEVVGNAEQALGPAGLEFERFGFGWGGVGGGVEAVEGAELV
ncbi:MAG: hypothetical protein RI897_3653 [Verrucomicrobiota bacterium]|jgi:hypothetical protein